MIASIVLKGMYNVGINSNNKIKVDGHLLSLSDVPFVRYRFDKYGEAELEFIKQNKTRMKGPVHLVEVPLYDGCAEVFDKIETMGGIARFLYIDVDDADINSGLKEETKNLLYKLVEADSFFDRVMLKDKSTLIYPMAAEKLKLQVVDALGNIVEAKDIGVCGSPLSFRHSDIEGQACLTAVWARKIMAEYADSADIVIPTASHECMSCCGCIQYLTVTEDIPAPLSAKEKSAAKKAENAEKGESKEKKEKAPKEPKEPKIVKPKRFGVWDDDL